MRHTDVAALAALLAVPAVYAQDMGEFTVGQIEVVGLQRISEGTVFNYLPVNIGDRMTPQKTEEALRALYSTGFFKDVELRRDGGTLVVVVQERPSIESFTITGNKDIKTEDLEKSLRGVGLSKGKIFNRSTLDEVERFLTDQYYSRGKYGVKIDTKVTDLPNNQVSIAIDIKEGKRSSIQQINIVGLEAVASPALLRSLFPKLLRGYAIDAIDAALAADPSPPLRPGERRLRFAAPEPFLHALSRARCRKARSLGAGEDLRLEGPGVSACALDAGGIAHLTAFAETGA